MSSVYTYFWLKRMNLPLTFVIINTLLCLTPATAQETSLSKNGCQQNCGDITIPYPFGIGPNCSFNTSYAIECNNQSKPFLKSTGLEVTEFFLNENTVRVMQKVIPLNCSAINTQFQLGQSLINSPFTFGASINRVIVVGCRSEVSLVGPAASSGGCRPTCGDAAAGCFGINCCSVIVPEMSQRVEVAYGVAEDGGGGGGGNDSVCGYVFLADYKWLSREYEDYVNFSTPVAEMALRSVPATLEWRFEVDEGYLHGAVCENRSVEPHTFDDNVYRFNLSRCRCREGFEGNPYLSCVDIDECRNSSLNNVCGFGSDCVNTDGGFMCKNRSGGNDMKSMIIGIGSAMGVLVLLGGVWILSKLIKNRIRANRRRRFFKRNGGLLLEQRLSSAERIKFFDPTELARATDGYDDDRILGRGGQGTVYKGMLRDGEIVAVKKAKRIGEVEEFVNEVVIMSQINHRNVLTLLGCCLETEVPLLVYEFVPNGTLSQHIHVRNKEFPLSWRMRVRIAAEVAGALSYLHNSAASPIYHRDIKSTNILLDGKYRAKVSDFGISRSVGVDQTHLTTRVFGTFGYLDPQYFWSSKFTEKSDVYSFGVVIVEILTGEKAISAAGVESGRNLAADFLHSMEENGLLEIVDPEVARGRVDEVVRMAELARRCLQPSGKRRPTMKEVATELEGILVMEQAPTLSSHHHETEFHSIHFEGSISDSTTKSSEILLHDNDSKVYHYDELE